MLPLIRSRMRENRRPISKRLLAAVLRLFRGQHGEKMVLCEGSARVTGISGRPTAILTQPKWGRGPNHHGVADVDWCRSNPRLRC